MFPRFGNALDILSEYCEERYEEALAAYRQASECREVPHIQTVGDHANPAQRGPLKGSLETLRPKKEREDAQGKGQRETHLAYPVVMRDEERIAEEWPRIDVSLIVIP